MKRASVSLSSCLEVVPEETIPWNPDTAPQAMVTNSRGTSDGASSVIRSLNAGAEISGAESNTAPYNEELHAVDEVSRLKEHPYR